MEEIKENIEVFLKLLTLGVSPQEAVDSVGWDDTVLEKLTSDPVINTRITAAQADFNVNLMSKLDESLDSNPKITLELLKLKNPKLHQTPIKLDILGEIIRYKRN